MLSDDEPYAFSATVMYKTRDAVLLDCGDFTKWFPKSQLKDHGDGTFSVPEWFAIKTGLV